jgi:hypothetical protein
MSSKPSPVGQVVTVTREELSEAFSSATPEKIYALRVQVIVLIAQGIVPIEESGIAFLLDQVPKGNAQAISLLGLANEKRAIPVIEDCLGKFYQDENKLSAICAASLMRLGVRSGLPRVYATAMALRMGGRLLEDRFPGCRKTFVCFLDSCECGYTGSEIAQLSDVEIVSKVIRELIGSAYQEGNNDIAIRAAALLSMGAGSTLLDEYEIALALRYGDLLLTELP